MTALALRDGAVGDLEDCGYCICNHQRKFTLQFAGKYRLQPPCKISLQFLNVPVTGATATVNSRNQSFATVITCYDHPKRYDGC